MNISAPSVSQFARGRCSRVASARQVSDKIFDPMSGTSVEAYVCNLKTKTEGDIQGIIVECTLQRVTVKTDATTEYRFNPSDFSARRRSFLSLMPEDLTGTTTDRELVDPLEFLTTCPWNPTSRSLPPTIG